MLKKSNCCKISILKFVLEVDVGDASSCGEIVVIVVVVVVVVVLVGY